MLCTFCAKMGAQRPAQNVHSVGRPAEARRAVAYCLRLLSIAATTEQRVCEVTYDCDDEPKKNTCKKDPTILRVAFTATKHFADEIAWDVE